MSTVRRIRAALTEAGIANHPRDGQPGVVSAEHDGHVLDVDAHGLVDIVRVGGTVGNATTLHFLPTAARNAATDAYDNADDAPAGVRAAVAAATRTTP